MRAERFGTIGELRAELRAGEPSERHTTTVADWLGSLVGFFGSTPAPLGR